MPPCYFKDECPNYSLTRPASRLRDTISAYFLIPGGVEGGVRIPLSQDGTLTVHRRGRERSAVDLALDARREHAFAAVWARFNVRRRGTEGPTAREASRPAGSARLFPEASCFAGLPGKPGLTLAWPWSGPPP